MQQLEWPELDYAKMKNTLRTMQLWSQIVGKLRMINLPYLNHSWNAALYISSRGLTTAAVPYGEGSFEIEFDFIKHELVITTNTQIETLPLQSGSISAFYKSIKQKLAALYIPAHIVAVPNELESAIPFAQDDQPRNYVPEQANAFFTALLKMKPVFENFRAGFGGKSSPVHFFWGAFDLTVSRFSGRPAPLHPGGMPNMPDDVMQECYSKEVCSAGFWAGNESFPQAAFYSYVYPTPEGYGKTPVLPAAAYYHEAMGEFILPYTAIQIAKNPENELRQFLEATYVAAQAGSIWE